MCACAFAVADRRRPRALSRLADAGRQIGEILAHVIFDTAHERAAWFSLASAEAVRLDAPLARPVETLSALPDWLRA